MGDLTAEMVWLVFWVFVATVIFLGVALVGWPALIHWRMRRAVSAPFALRVEHVSQTLAEERRRWTSPPVTEEQMRNAFGDTWEQQHAG